MSDRRLSGNSFRRRSASVFSKASDKMLNATLVPNQVYGQEAWDLHFDPKELGPDDGMPTLIGSLQRHAARFSSG
jgi:hypothetical protein